MTAPPVKLEVKVRDHFGIEICDAAKNKWALSAQYFFSFEPSFVNIPNRGRYH